MNCQVYGRVCPLLLLYGRLSSCCELLWDMQLTVPLSSVLHFACSIILQILSFFPVGLPTCCHSPLLLPFPLVTAGDTVAVWPGLSSIFSFSDYVTP